MVVIYYLVLTMLPDQVLERSQEPEDDCLFVCYGPWTLRSSYGWAPAAGLSL